MSVDQQTQSRIDEIEQQLEMLDLRLASNPLDASANARYKYLSCVLAELKKSLAIV